MEKLVVNVKKLNKRKVIPSSLPDNNNISGMVFLNYTFYGDEVIPVPNPALGKWYKDKDGYFYWGGGLNVFETIDADTDIFQPADSLQPASASITTQIKNKIEHVVNVFETGSVQGDYSELVKYFDYNNPVTKTKTQQVTYGRSQTTEFGNLKDLIQDYVQANGMYAAQLQPYINRIGNQPTLASDNVFCQTLINAGKNDPVMITCQDNFFDKAYYTPAFNWFTTSGFTFPLSLLVIYDSKVHSGGILSFLTNKFLTKVPAAGGNEKEWITNYVEVRQNWLANSSSSLLRATVYRTECFQQQILNNNWDLSQKINAHGIIV